MTTMAPVAVPKVEGLSLEDKVPDNVEVEGDDVEDDEDDEGGEGAAGDAKKKKKKKKREPLAFCVCCNMH